MDQRAQFDRAPRARTGDGGSVRREGDLIWLAARRNGRLRRERQAVAQRDDLDGPAGRGAGHIHGAARDPRGLLPPGGNQPGFFARGVQSAVGERRGAGGLRQGRPAHAPRIVRGPGSDRPLDGGLFERLVARAARPADAQVVGRDSRRRGPRRRHVPRAGARDPRCGQRDRGLRCRDWTLARNMRGRGLRRRDGRHAGRGRVLARRGVRRRRHRGAGLRGLGYTARRRHDAGRVSPARRS